MLKHKVLVAIPCLMLGGTEYQTLNLVKALKESGYDVKVLCYFEHDPQMVFYMREVGAEIELMSPEGKRPTGLWAISRALFTGIRQALKSYKPDIVHVQYMAPGSLAILLFKLLGAKKVIATAHVPGHVYRRKWIPRLISKHLTDCFLSVSKSSEEAFFNEEAQLFSKELFSKGRKHFTIYNCVELDPDYIKVVDQKNEDFTIGIVSRLSHEKGIDIMISAMPMILKNYSKIRLLIVGDGVEKENLQNLAIKLNVGDIITWTGLQPKEKLLSYYTQMDIVAVPSRFEGFGLTAIEAMSYEIPIVASAVDGLKEVIVNGESGTLFESEDSDTLANAVVDLIQDDEKRALMALVGKKRVVENFSYRIYQQKITELYEAEIGSNN